MVPQAADEPQADPARAVGLAWLLRLRWGAVLGQTALVLVARLVLGLSFSLVVVAPLLAATALTNGGLSVWLRRGGRSSQRIMALVLVFDTAVLTAILHATGGAANPFSVFYLVHVALGALLLDAGGALLVAGVTSIGFATLFAGFMLPGLAPPSDDMMSMHHMHHGSPMSFSVHLQGMWVAYTLAAIFLGYFVTRLTRALERQKQEMLALQQVAAKAEKLASLSTLAAGAAHELGTPLGTIAVVAKELERACERKLDPESVQEDARLLRAEADRCRDILAQMGARAGANQGEAARTVEAHTMAAKAVTSLDRARAARVEVRAADQGLHIEAPPRALVQALVNLVRNGLDASEDLPEPRRRVTLSVVRAGEFVDFVVTDAGAGIAPEIVSRLGEPFLTTKPPGRGLGLGLFLVRAFADRVCGRLDIASIPGEGTRVTLSVPAIPLEEAAKSERSSLAEVTLGVP